MFNERVVRALMLTPIVLQNPVRNAPLCAIRAEFLALIPLLYKGSSYFYVQFSSNISSRRSHLQIRHDVNEACHKPKSHCDGNTWFSQVFNEYYIVFAHICTYARFSCHTRAKCDFSFIGMKSLVCLCMNGGGGREGDEKRRRRSGGGGVRLSTSYAALHKKPNQNEEYTYTKTTHRLFG